MGKAKVVNYYNGRYCGDMSADQCDILENIIKLDEENGCLEDLKHIITNVSSSDVDMILNDVAEHGKVMHSYDKGIGTLRDDQTLGVAFMVSAKRCMLGDSVGLGKTVQTAGAVNLISALKSDSKRPVRYLVLTEKNLAVQFRRELIQFTGEYVELIGDGEQKTMKKFVANHPYQEELNYSIVGTHALLTTKSFIQWLEQSRTLGPGFPFTTLIVDESSILGGKAKLLLAGFTSLSKYFENIYFLNATPFGTSLEMFYNQLNLLDNTLLPPKTKCMKEFCVFDYTGMHPRPTNKYKNQAQFKSLIKYRYFARTRKGKGAVMSGCDGRVVLSPLSPIQKEWLRKSQLHYLVYDCPNYLDPAIPFTSTTVPKLGSLAHLLETDCKDAKTIIIFAPYKEAQKHLAAWLETNGYSTRILNGDTKKAERQELIDGFKKAEYRVLITNVQRGLNFGSCNHCIFYSFDTNPSEMLQFEGRITRDFDVIGKHIYILCSEGKEYKKLNTAVRERAKATTDFTNTDLSVILNILLERNDELDEE